MKSIYLFSTKLWAFLTEIPFVVVFWLAFKYNELSESTFKFYPLMIVSAFFIIFTMVYFFRYVSINNDEIRCHGIFSSKENSLITENRTLVINLCPRSNIKLELYSGADEAPAFEWMKANDAAHRDVCIFRARAVGGKRSVSRVLEYFTLSEEDAERAFADGFNFENDSVKVDTKQENEILKIKIFFKITII